MLFQKWLYEQWSRHSAYFLNRWDLNKKHKYIPRKLRMAENLEGMESGLLFKKLTVLVPIVSEI